MSKKTLMGLALAVTVAIAPVASFAKKVECYGANGGAKDSVVTMKSNKACKKAGGTTKPQADKSVKSDAPATTETPAS
jgi:hypothetical protein